jgi:hypothetical protein
MDITIALEKIRNIFNMLFKIKLKYRINIEKKTIFEMCSKTLSESLLFIDYSIDVYVT